MYLLCFILVDTAFLLCGADVPTYSKATNSKFVKTSAIDITDRNLNNKIFYILSSVTRFSIIKSREHQYVTVTALLHRSQLNPNMIRCNF